MKSGFSQFLDLFLFLRFKVRQTQLNRPERPQSQPHF
jgi:hypothetical protein